jgi:transcriptional regulator with XRE-family HTH domain
MPARETPRQRGARRATDLLRRLGEEFRRARVGAGLGCRAVATAVGISHTQQLRIERGEAPHVDVVVLARIAIARPRARGAPGAVPGSPPCELALADRGPDAEE